MRYASTLLAVTLLAAGSGCRMCCSPYDYSGPVCPQPCGNCCPVDRAGSAFTGFGMPIADGHEWPMQYQEGTIYESIPAEPQEGPSGTPAQPTRGETILTPIPDGRFSQRPAPNRSTPQPNVMPVQRTAARGQPVYRASGQHPPVRYRQ
jgi:hypothetical protein